MTTRGRHTPESLQRFAEKHGIETLSAFWWCGGHKWERRDYRVELLATADYGKKGIAAEATTITGTTPRALFTQMKQAGFVPPPVKEIARLCESAGCSPQPPTQKRSA